MRTTRKQRPAVDGSQLEAGYGERDITPPRGVDLAGYGFYLDRRAASVLDPLKARVLFLRRGGEQLVIISCDLIGVSVEYADAVRERIADSLHIASNQVLFACTHTHSGPATKTTLGLGNVDPEYMGGLQGSIVNAVAQARDDAASARFSFGRTVAEPLGYNRRTGVFQPIDPAVKIGFFARKSNTIHLVSYACHPVTLGPTDQVSADWPGALAGAFDKDGHRCVFLQGCCGDIDPVTNLNQWGSGGPADIVHFASLVAHWVGRTSERAIDGGNPRLYSAEIRTRIPLAPWSPREIEQKALRFSRDYRRFPGAVRFAREWKDCALKRRTEVRRNPYLDNVPIQLLSIGDLNIVSLPGEAFCEIGLELQAGTPHTWAIGYANGTIGYIPTRSAYGRRDDYACYCAPRFQTLFPFTPDIERIILRKSGALMKGRRT
jgi:hypothetical protein